MSSSALHIIWFTFLCETAIKKFNTILLGFGRRGDYLSLFLGGC